MILCLKVPPCGPLGCFDWSAVLNPTSLVDKDHPCQNES